MRAGLEFFGNARIQEFFGSERLAVVSRFS